MINDDNNQIIIIILAVMLIIYEKSGNNCIVKLSRYSPIMPPAVIANIKAVIH